MMAPPNTKLTPDIFFKVKDQLEVYNNTAR